MLYRVTFLLSGEEETDIVDANDAASAVARAQFDHGRSDAQFELMSVHLLDDESDDTEPLND